MRFKTFIGSEQIDKNPIKIELIREAVSRFQKRPTFLFLSMLNNYLCLRSGALPDDDSKPDPIAATIFGSLFDDETWQIIRQTGEHLNRQGHSVVVLHRWQMLGLMKMMILWGSDKGLDPNSDRNARFELGKVCLMATSFLSPEPGATSKDEIRALLMPTFELTNPPELYNSIARSFSYLNIASNVSLVGLGTRKINDLFEQKYGVSIFKYLGIVYAIYAKYEVLKSNPIFYFNQPKELNISRREHFKHLTFTEFEIDKVFELISIDPSAFYEKGEFGSTFEFDFLGFRKTPIIKVSDDIYTCVDLEFLAEKLGVTNWFLAIRDGLPDDPEKPGRRDNRLFSSLNDTWGKEIFERYVGTILLSEPTPYLRDFRLRNHKIIPQNRNPSENNKPRFDWGLFNANSLILSKEVSWLIWIECKTLRLDVLSKYGNEPDKLKNKLLDKFKLSDGKNQIIAGIELIINGKASGLTRLASTIYPVIIIEDELFGIAPVSDLIVEGFDKLLQSINIPKSFHVKPLTLFTIETFERIERFVTAGHFSLQEFLEFRSRTTSADFHEILNDFLRAKGITHQPMNNRLNALFDQFHEEFMDYFRPEAYDNPL